MTGKVKSYNTSTRYGFITDGHEDFRFHLQDWKAFEPPYKGLEVDFVPYFSDKGWRAEDIRDKEK